MSSSILRKANKDECPALAGFTYVPVDLDRIKLITMKAVGAGIRYLFGGKDESLGDGLIDFHNGIDCSGWERTMMDYVTHNILRTAGFPDGSYTQGQWLINHDFKTHLITSASQYLSTVAKDGFLRIGFHWPGGRGGDSIGHVFTLLFDPNDPKFSLGNKPVTDESYGGHGPGVRPYTHQWFLDHTDAIIVIGPMVKSNNWAYPLTGKPFDMGSKG